MAWSLYRNLQASLIDYLIGLSEDENLLDSEGNSINFYVGRKNDQSWNLNAISVHFESQTSPRGFISSNQRLESFLMIINIFAKTEIDRLELARWVTLSINDGFPLYTYAYNSENPELPIKTSDGWTRVNFLTNTRVNLGQNVSETDAHRHSISITVQLVK